MFEPESEKIPNFRIKRLDVQARTFGVERNRLEPTETLLPGNIAQILDWIRSRGLEFQSAEALAKHTDWLLEPLRLAVFRRSRDPRVIW